MKRNVIVISSNTQTRKDFKDVEVTTLADVKKLLDDAGISYTDQAFYEGVSKAEYTSDDSIMPSNMPFKGEITNDLVFMLSNKSKKISSGARSRQECFKFIKEHNMAKSIKEKYNLMYTSVSTDDLNKEIDSFVNADADEKCGHNCTPCGSDIAHIVLGAIIEAFSKNGYSIVKPKGKTVNLSDDDIDSIIY